MNRWISLIGIAIGLCSLAAAHGQSPVRRVAVLVPAATWEPEVFRASLKERGFSEGSNLSLDVRVAGGKLELLPDLARDLVRGAPEAIVAVNTPGTAAAAMATKTIPIVMVSVGDPIGNGFVSNLSRPEGNITGFSNLCGELAGKRLALLKEALPRAKRIAVMLNPADPVTKRQIPDVKRAAKQLNVDIEIYPAPTTADVDAAFAPILKRKSEAIFWLCGQGTALERHTILRATPHRLPVMVANGTEVPAGALIAYATDLKDYYRRAAAYVEKLLKGAKVTDLPVEQPSKFELIVNLKAAKALGIAVPQSILLRADRTIE